MPNRILREGIIDSDRVDRLSEPAEVFYRRLMSVVDDFGRFEADPVILRAKCYPRRTDKLSIEDIQCRLGETVDAGLVALYMQGRKRYLQIIDFNQRIRSESKFPPPPETVIEKLQSPKAEGSIYFIQAENSKRVKIGYTEMDPDSRLCALQTGSPERLILLGSIRGTMKKEREIQRRFSSDSVGGEWFAYSETIASLIDELLRANARECAPTRARGRSDSSSDASSDALSNSDSNSTSTTTNECERGDKDAEIIRASLTAYMECLDVGEPDDEIVEQVLASAPHVPAMKINEFLCEKYKSSPPGSSSGPKGWGWFPAVVRKRFNGNGKGIRNRIAGPPHTGPPGSQDRLRNVS